MFACCFVDFGFEFWVFLWQLCLIARVTCYICMILIVSCVLCELLFVVDMTGFYIFVACVLP